MITRLDRLSLIRHVPKEHLVGHEHRLQTLSTLIPSKLVPLQNADGTRYNFFFAGGGASGTARISVERRFGICFVKYDFKPSAFDFDAYKTMVDATSMLGAGSLKETTKHGVSTYLEAAVDFVDRKTTEFVYFLPYAQATTNGSKRIGSTYYLGSSRSSVCVAIYDRGSHPEACPFESEWSGLTRVEVRLRGPKAHLPPMQIGSLVNPFRKLIICDREELCEVLADDPEAVELVHLCNKIGSPHAFAFHPKLKKLVIKTAKQHQANWWQPDSLMQGWQETVQTQLRFKMLGLDVP